MMRRRSRGYSPVRCPVNVLGEQGPLLNIKPLQRITLKTYKRRQHLNLAINWPFPRNTDANISRLSTFFRIYCLVKPPSDWFSEEVRGSVGRSHTMLNVSLFSERSVVLPVNTHIGEGSCHRPTDPLTHWEHSVSSRRAPLRRHSTHTYCPLHHV